LATHFRASAARPRTAPNRLTRSQTKTPLDLNKLEQPRKARVRIHTRGAVGRVARNGLRDNRCRMTQTKKAVLPQKLSRGASRRSDAARSVVRAKHRCQGRAVLQNLHQPPSSTSCAGRRFAPFQR
jgi:hypothetical protein